MIRDLIEIILLKKSLACTKPYCTQHGIIHSGSIDCTENVPCTDPESFARGGPTMQRIFVVVIL